MRRLTGTFSAIFNSYIFPSYEVNKMLNVNDILLDETGYTNSVEMLIPKDMDGNSTYTLEDLRKELQRYDLDILKAEREVKLLVIHEKGYQPIK